MQAWLYQMRSREGWCPEDYRLRVWEGATADFPVGRITSRGKAVLTLGDLVVFFFTRAGTDDPGIYGWAVVTKLIKRGERMEFRALPPSDYLKVDPIWNPIVEAAAERIRATVKQGTMWHIVPTDLALLRDQIRKASGRPA